MFIRKFEKILLFILLGLVVLLTYKDLKILNINENFNVITKQIEEFIEKQEGAGKLLNFGDKNYCENGNSEWEPFNQDLYLRPSAGYYFTDQKSINILYMSHSEINFEIAIHLSIKTDESVFLNYIPKTISKSLSNYSPYKANVLVAHFDLDQFLVQTKIDKLSVTLEAFISHLHDNKTINKNPIKLKLKSIHENFASKKNSMICSKIYSLKEDDYLLMEWWFMINLQMGIDKIVIYNNSIVNTRRFRNLFERYNELVEVRQAQCLPIFAKKISGKKYFRSLNELHMEGENFPHRWTLETLIFNECYLDYINSYKTVLVVDQDEAILPRNDKQLSWLSNDLRYLEHFDNDQCYSNDDRKELINYYDDLIYYSKSKKYSNFHFKMAFYLSNKFTGSIFKRLNEFYSTNKVFKLPQSVLVKDEEQSSYESRDVIYNYTIDNIDQFNYGFNLTKFYMKRLKPFLENNMKIIKENVHETYSRMFFLVNEETESHFGKTLHNTMNTLYLWHHHPLETFSDVPHRKVPFEYGHLSHFRKRYALNVYSSSIYTIKFDLNYFACYLRPILNKITK